MGGLPRVVNYDVVWAMRRRNIVLMVDAETNVLQLRTTCDLVELGKMAYLFAPVARAREVLCDIS